MSSRQVKSNKGADELIEPVFPDPELIAKAARVLVSGGVVAFPTETSYGLGASIYRQEALEKIYQIKKRPKDKPLLVLIPDITYLSKLAADIPKVVDLLVERFWPGPLTLILKAKANLPWPLCASTGKIGVRISSNPWAFALVKQVGHPITATSANLSGLPPASTAKEVAEQLKDPAPDMILDGGAVPGIPPSTILDVSVDPPRLLRVGVIGPEDIPVLHELGPS